MKCLTCALPALLEASQPPDPEVVDLIEWAFLDGQIDGFALDLAHIFLISQVHQPSAQLAH
jgi:hypothetical protein